MQQRHNKKQKHKIHLRTIRPGVLKKNIQKTTGQKKNLRKSHLDEEKERKKTKKKKNV